MKFLDLFAGIGGFRLGLEQAGHTCVGFVEIDKFARKSYEAIFDTKGEYTEHDINNINTKELPEADIWCFGFPCFTGDTLVQTKAGLKEIKDVLVNDEVVTIDGSWQKVLTTMNKMSTNVYNLKVQGQVDTKVTGNHPYWVRKKIRTHSGYKYSTPEWLEVEKIKQGDLVQSLRYKEAIEIPELSLDTLWLLGRYVADGYLFSQKRKDRPNPTYRTIFSIRTSKVKEFKKKLENFNMTEDKSAGKYVHKFVSTDKELYRLSSEFGKLAHNKEIPAYIFNMSKKQQETFLLGYLSGDGDITKKGYTRANSVSKKLIIGLSKLVESVYGCSVSIFYTKRPNKYIIEGREVNQRNTWTLQYSTKAKVKSYNQEQGVQWYPVKEIIPIEGTYTVYNLEVQNNNTYNANGVIIHNCQDISVAGKQKGFEGNRSSLFFAVTRKLHELKDEKKPSYLLIENVKNLLSINGGWDFAKLQIELDSLGYDIEWDLLNSKEVVPQNRERVFIIGHFRGRSTRKVFPITRKGEPTSDERQKISIVGTTKPSSSTRLGQRDVVYDSNSLMGTLGATDYKRPKQIAVKQVGNISNSDSFGGNPQVGRVYSTDGLSPALNTMQGGGREPKIISDDKGDFIKHGTKILSKLWERTKTENYAEWSERVSQLVSTTEILRQIMYEQLLSQDSSEIRKCELVCSPQESQRSRYGYSLQDLWSNQEYRHPSYRRKYSEQFTREFNCFVQKLPHEATQKKAYMQNLWKTSKRAPSLQQALHQMEKIWGSFISQNQSKRRIRKITSLEAWRLQGFPDWAFDRAEKVNSNSQLYKQAGNSVTVPVIYEIAKRMNWFKN